MGSACAVAISALGGLFVPHFYARETPIWAAQAIAQDGLNLVVVVPLLVIGVVLARRGSTLGPWLLTGTMLFSAYSFVLYAFDVHFNRLFLVYCAGLGLSAYGAAGLLMQLLAADRARAIGGWEIVAGWSLAGVAGLAALLWLSAIVPALYADAAPADVVAAGLLTNPVHVLDLSLLLPGQFMVGVQLLRNRRGGALGPAFLLFDVLMAINIAVIAVSSGAAAWPVVAVLGAFGLLDGVVLYGLLRRSTAAR